MKRGWLGGHRKMTSKEMKALRPGDRVQFDGIPGTVTANNGWCVMVDWDDGQLDCGICVDDGLHVETARVKSEPSRA
jgi:hypothetical protein